MGRYKLYLNEKNEYIDILTDDALLFDRFGDARRKIMDMASVLPRKYQEIEKRYEKCSWKKTIELYKVDVVFSKEAIKIIDGVFGKGSIKKYFRKISEKVPDFTPNLACFMDFFEQITPVMEQLFDRKIQELERIKR